MTLELLSKYSYLAKKGIVIDVFLGSTLGLTPDSPIEQNQKNFGIHYDQLGNWVYDKTNNTMKVRIKRWFKLKDHCDNLGFKIDDRQVQFLSQELKKIEDFEKNIHQA